MSVLHANIQVQNSHQKQGSGKKGFSQLRPTMMVPKVLAQVVRGESVDIPIVATPFRPGVTSVKILIPPHHGILTQIDNDPGKAAVFRYLHDREFSDEEEAFTFLVTDSQLNLSGTRQIGRILIRNPHATLIFNPEERLDFGKVPLGETVSKIVTLSNAFGSTISGVLRVAPPWRIDDDPNVVLREGSSRAFTISFAPRADGEESSRVSFDPDTVSLPELILHGSGQAPFEVVAPAVLKLTKDSPRDSITLSNTTDRAITVAWRGDSSGLETSPPVSIPPKGTAEAWVSSRIVMPCDTVAKRVLTLSSSAYSLPVKFEIRGPKGGLSLELLRGGETIGAVRGEALLLEGIVRNSSETERDLHIRIENPEGETKLPSKHLVIPPKSFLNFQFSWFPGALGDRELPVLVSEGEKLVGEDHWKVSVRDRILSSVPATKPSPHSPRVVVQTNTPQGGIYLATDNFKAKAVVEVRPFEERGILMNHLVLKWRYFGPEKTVFAVEEKHVRNALTDRTGSESTNVWKRVVGAVKSGSGGVCSIRIQMPLPGSHEYRIYPVGVDQEVAIAPVTVEVSQSMFWWPWIRDLLLLLFLIAFLKFLRNRL
jgi:hypothetical protein